ncbi:hypothetical protein SD457_13650 [Coprobacillaceae bacterium CR2/5/TPMF4]|nr:hypothetical protein SD457_13650 [Coprobacillaceae bacterium CR2/5/TPMF4]
MKYTTLGNSDLKVSKVCLGCMGFGDAQKECIHGLYQKINQEKLLNMH